MQYLIYHENKQEGPYEAEVIRDRLARGEYAPGDLCFGDGMPGWTPLSDVPELAPLGAPAPAINAPPLPAMAPRTAITPPPPMPGAVPPKESFWQTVLEKLSVTAKLTQKQALRKKIEISDLRNADYATGKKAYESGLAPAECAGLVAQLDNLRQQAATLQGEQTGPTNTLGDKAKEATRITVRAAKMQAVHTREGLLLTELGEKIRSLTAHPALAGEIGAARKITEMLVGIDAEIVALSTRTYSWARQPLWALVAILVIAGLAFGYHFFHGETSPTYTVYQPSVPAAAAYAATVSEAPTKTSQFVYPSDHKWIVDEQTDRAVEHGQPTPAQEQAYSDAMIKMGNAQQAAAIEKEKEQEAANVKAQADQEAARQAAQTKSDADRAWRAAHPYDWNTDDQKQTFAAEMALLPAWMAAQPKDSTTLSQASQPASVDFAAVPLGPMLKGNSDEKFFLSSPDYKRSFVLAHQGTDMVAYIDGHPTQAYPKILWTRYTDSDASSLNGSPSFSADAQSAAFMVQNADNRQAIVVNGTETPSYEKIDSMTFGPQGHSLVYVAEDGNRCVIYLNGREVGSEPRGYTQLTPSVSPDGQRVLYTRYQNRESVVMADGTPGATFDGNRGVSWSGDSKHFAYIGIRGRNGERGGKAFVVIDTKEIPVEGDVQNLTLSDTGGHYAYVNYHANGQSPLPFNPMWGQYNEVVSVIWDGKEFGHYSHVGVQEVGLSPDGGRMAFIVPTNINGNTASFMVVDNGHPGKAYDSCQNMVFSPDGSKLAYQAQANGQVYLVINGKEFGPYSNLYPLRFAFSPDNAHFTYQAVQVGGNQEQLYMDGELFSGPAPDWALSGQERENKAKAAYVPPARLKAVTLPDQKGMRASLDGHPGPPFPAVSDMILSPDGAHVAYVNTIDPYTNITEIVVDGSATTRFSKLFYLGPASRTCTNHLVFNPDGSLQFVCAYNDTIYRCTVPAATIAALPTLPQLDASGSGWRPLDFTPVTPDCPAPTGFAILPDGKIYAYVKNGMALVRAEADGSNLTLLHAFGQHNGELKPADGNLLMDTDGNVYGFCKQGGTNNLGGIYRIDGKTGAFSVIHNFEPTSYQGGAFGVTGFGLEGYPNPSIVVAKQSYNSGPAEILHMKLDGSGVTTMAVAAGIPAGGFNGGCGAFYNVSNNMAFVRCSTLTPGSVPLHTFAGPPDDTSSCKGLIIAPDGKLYGWSESGDFFRVNRDGSDYKLLCKAVADMQYNGPYWANGKIYVTGLRGLTEISPTDGSTNVVADNLGRQVMGAHDGVIYAVESSVWEHHFRFILPHSGMITPPTLNLKIEQPAP